MTPNNTYYDGGSISWYSSVNLITGEREQIDAPTAPPQFGGGKAQPFKLSDNIIVVQFGMFRGKTAAPHIYATETALKTLGVDYV